MGWDMGREMQCCTPQEAHFESLHIFPESHLPSLLVVNAQWWEGEQTRFEVLAKARCVSHFQAHPTPEAIAKLPPFLQQRAQARHPLPTLAAVAPPPPSAESTPTQKGKRPRADVAEEAEDIGELRATADFVATRLCPQLFVELRRALVPQHMWDGPGPADERY